LKGGLVLQDLVRLVPFLNELIFRKINNGKRYH